ncbi:MAG: AAA family ATPase [Cytophagaceae bacterium]|nr:AAA family ATPase [Cytophagaceae bacterium]
MIAGPNGVGKSTAAFQIVPTGVEQLNADDIARQIRQNQTRQEVVLQLTNDELQRRVNGHIQRQESFAIETNLHDHATWQYFMAFKKLGYRFELIFLSTSELTILYNRVVNRHLQGGHFVREDVIRGRYEAGLHLLNQFFDQPDSLTLIDATDRLSIVYKRIDGQITEQIQALPTWVLRSLSSHLSAAIAINPAARSADTIGQVRAMYQQQREKINPTNE